MKDMDEASVPLLSATEWINSIENPDQGAPIPTLFQPHIPPLVRGRCTVLGADTGEGKTAFGLQAWRHVLDCGHSAAYITLEMTPPDLFARFHPQFDSEDDCKDWIREREAYVSESYCDAHEVERIIKQGFDFVVLDHIHELPFDGHEDLGRKVRRLASLAPSTNTSLLMLSQMKRPEFGPQAPTKHDFSWTKAIAEVAAVAMALYKEDDHSNYIELHTVKNRFGPKPPPLGLSLNSRTIEFERT